MLACVAGFGFRLSCSPSPPVCGFRSSRLVAAGGFDMVSMVIRQTLVQIATPDLLRGRVSAVNLCLSAPPTNLASSSRGSPPRSLAPCQRPSWAAWERCWSSHFGRPFPSCVTQIDYSRSHHRRRHLDNNPRICISLATKTRSSYDDRPHALARPSSFELLGRGACRASHFRVLIAMRFAS